MKTTATKLSVLVFLGLGLVAYGQSGKVGVNISSPRATLDVQPNAINGQDNAKTNEGILAPKLSKTRVASIEIPVEGTLVYVIDDADKTNGTIGAYKGTDPRVAKITEKGYYYYDGTEWVKSTAGAKEQEWGHNGTDAIYAKRAKSNNHSFEILDNGRTYTNQGNVNWQDVSFNIDGLPSSSQDPRGSAVNLRMMSSAILPLNDIGINKTDPSVGGYNFMGNLAYVYQAHAGVAEGVRKSYSTGNHSLEFKDTSANIFYAHSLAGTVLIRKEVSSPFEYVRGSSSSVRHLGSGVVTNLIGANAEAYAEGTGNVINAIGVQGIAYSRKEGKASEVLGGDFQAHVRDNATKANTVFGVQSTLQALDSNTMANFDVAGAANFVVNANSPVEYRNVFGNRLTTHISENATVLGSVSGVNLANNIRSNNTIPILNGVKSSNVLLGTGNFGKIMDIMHIYIMIIMELN
ncbi:hypothetical protein PG291_09040 [Riemerella anatipestifer]|nr:hypothetical protein [Riemerella anatipestifer]